MIEDLSGKRFRRKASSVMTEINVTPFVDVMLVLLIIFIVTAPLMQSGIKVDLPKQETGSLEIREENVVTIRKDGAIFFNEKRITQSDLLARLKSMVAQSPTVEVFLRADQKLAYGVVVSVMGVIKKAGVSRLGMVTIPPDTEPRKGKR